jgi:hypothetical protein
MKMVGYERIVEPGVLGPNGKFHEFAWTKLLARQSEANVYHGRLLVCSGALRFPDVELADLGDKICLRC